MGLEQRAALESGTRVYSYVVSKDAGFAPNPFGAACTLACCKPMIRAGAVPGDLVVGLSSRCETIVYVGRVAERLTTAEYWETSRFKGKRPNWRAERLVERVGDNIYEPLVGGGFRQLRSAHWNHEADRPSRFHTRKDTGPDSVLVMEDFVYFGGEGPELPGALDFLVVARGHRCRFSEAEVGLVASFFDELPRGVQGRPALWSEEDRSCMPNSCA